MRGHTRVGARIPARVGALALAIARGAIVGASCAFVLWSCALVDTPTAPPLPDELVAEPSFSRDIAPVLERRCSVASCHSFSSRRLSLVLDVHRSYDELVPDAPCPTTRPQPDGCSFFTPGMALVQPGDANVSWLVKMISPDSVEARHGLDRMPLGRPPLTDNQIANIVTWINQGAARH